MAAQKAFELAGSVVVDTATAERGLKRLDKTARETGRGLESSFRSSGTAAGGLLSVLSRVSNIISAIPQVGRLIGSVTRPLLDATEAGIRFNMTMENAVIGLEGVAGGVENAKRHIAALQTFAEKTPFEFTGLLKSSRYMTTFGFALDEQLPKLKAWGNAVSASGDLSEETLMGVVRAFGQMRAKGNLSAEEMEQLAERGIPSWELLARAIGKTVEQTRKLSEQGRLRGGPAVEAITDMINRDPRYRGMMDRMSGTLSGRLSNLEDVRERVGGQATQNLSKEMSNALGAALEHGDLAETMAGSINAAVGAVAPVIKAAVIGEIGGGITGGLKEGIEAGKAEALKAVSDLGLGAILSMKSVLGIQSPSKVFMSIGEMAAEGFKQGLANGLAGGVFADEIEKAIAAAARATGLDPNLIRAVIRQESGGRRDAVSAMGAKGLMQLMPGTAARYGVKNVFDPAQNVMGGSKYLAELLAEFKNLRLALAAYNAGEGAVRAYLPNRPNVNSYVGGSGRRWTVSEEAAQRAQGIPRNGQTPNYVNSIMSMFGGGSGWRQPLPVTIVGSGLPLAGDNFRDVPGGSGLDDARLPSSGGWRFDNSMLQPSRAFSNIGSGGSAAVSRFDFLAAIGGAGEAAEKSFDQAGEASRNWFKEVVTESNKAADEMQNIFRSAFEGMFSHAGGGLGGMFAGFGLDLLSGLQSHFAQKLSAQLFGGAGPGGRQTTGLFQKWLPSVFGKPATDDKSNPTSQATLQNTQRIAERADQINASIDRSAFQMVGAIHELGHTMVALQPAQPGFWGGLLQAFAQGALGALGGSLFKTGGGGADEGPSQPRPTSPPVLKKARGGPIPAWHPVQLAEEGTEAVLFDRPGHVMNSADTRRLMTRGGSTPVIQQHNHNWHINGVQNPSQFLGRETQRQIAQRMRRTLEAAGPDY